jgi:hypothetical protein
MGGKNGASVLKTVIGLQDLAALTVQSERNVHRLTRLGVLRLAKDSEGRQLRGRYELGDAMPRFVEHLRDQIAKADPNEAAYIAARARRMLAVAQSEELRVKLQRGELLEADRVDAEVMGVLVTVKQHMLALGSAITRQLLGLLADKDVTYQKVYSVVHGGIRRGLTELADGDPKKILPRRKVIAPRRRNDGEQPVEA